MQWLDELLKTGLVLNYDPTVQHVADATLLEISPAGRQHLYWATGSHEYLSAMADVTPLLSEATFTEMQDHRHPKQWRARTKVFLEYLLREDVMYCLVPDHKAYESQGRLRSTVEAVATRLTADTGRRPTSSTHSSR